VSGLGRRPRHNRLPDVGARRSGQRQLRGAAQALGHSGPDLGGHSQPHRRPSARLLLQLRGREAY